MAKNGSNRPRKASKGVLCVELALGVDPEDAYVSAVVSIPGREGTVTRSWGRAGVAMSESDVHDFESWLHVTVRHVFLSRHGIQMLLPS